MTDAAVLALQRQVGLAPRAPRRFRCASCKKLTEPERRGVVRADLCFRCDLRISAGIKVKKKAKTEKQLKDARRHARIKRLLKRQPNRCAICGSRFTKKYPPQIDHCHEKGHDRGLLCKPCNVGLGHFHDDPARLRAAADYLEANAEDRED